MRTNNPATEYPPAIRTLWTGGAWFEANPEKVAGITKQTTNQYGELVNVVKGTMADVDRILNPQTKPYIFPYLQPEAATAQPKVIKITEALKRTADANQPDLKTEGLIGMEEMIKRWAPDVTQDDLAVWAYYQKNKLFKASAVAQASNGWSKYVNREPEIDKWLEKGLVAYDGFEFVPSYLYYAGNIYAKNTELRNQESRVVAKIGRDGYEKQLQRLIATAPRFLTINTAENERLYISPLDPIVNTFQVSRLADGTIFSSKQFLKWAFEGWINNLPRGDFKNGSSASDIRNHFLANEQFARGTDEREKISRKRKAQLDGIGMFQRFLFEMLTREDQQKLEYLWNTEFNNWQEIDFKKIPVGFEINKWFKYGPIDPRTALWDGVKFLSANGSGIIAFDVGVGKTMTAILAMAQALYTGQCKRPLIVVPNPTYKKWIEETVGSFDENGKCTVAGVLPQFKDRINDYYNLGVGYEQKAKLTPPEDYTITFITYQGLELLGFGDAVSREMEMELFTILNQGLSGRDREKLREKISELLGDATAKAVVNIDDLGFDYLVIDEAHNCKKIFTSVKGRVEEDGEREQSSYHIKSGTKPSDRGLKAFMVSQFIMKRNNMRNIVLLTATPFTNSPLEIYSMLALVGYQTLQERGIENLQDFFDKFINESFEMVVTSRSTLENRAVIRSFNNKIVLQNIIFSNILYKTGEEAKVSRPKKLVYPYLRDANGILLTPEDRVDTALQPTSEQQYWLNEIAIFANEGGKSLIGGMLPLRFFENNDRRRRIPAIDLLCISMAQACTLSPYLLKADGVPLYDKSDPTAKEYIESSPKLKYVMECVASVRKWHLSRKEAVSCQVIYMNMAKDYFPLIKQYLIEEVGYARKEVEIIKSGLDKDKKERIKEDFLEGKVKIIIGSATIKEGIDLQNKSTVLYCCNLDWNPTDLIQLEGRIWRQGNQHNYVRIVLPLIENSIDVFMFQKLEEKTSRINDIWYRAGRNNVMNIEELNPGELKTGLMTNPEERAKADIKGEEDRYKFDKEIYDGYLKELSEAKVTVEDYNNGIIKIEYYFIKAKEYLENKLSIYQTQLSAIEETPGTGQEGKVTEYKKLAGNIESLTNLFAEEITDKAKFAYIKRAARGLIQESTYKDTYYTWIDAVDKQIRRIAIMDRIQNNILSKNGLTLMDDFSPVVADYQAQAAELQRKLDETKTPEYLKAKRDLYQKQREALDAQSLPLEERVKEFTKYNYLLSCLNKIDECGLETKAVKKLPQEAEVPQVPLVPSATEDKTKRLRIVKVKAKALILLQDQQQLNVAA